MEKQTKELDLLDLIKELFSFIAHLFIKVGTSFLWILRFVIKYYIIFLLSFAIGIGLFFFLKSPKQRLYNADFIIHLNVSNCFVVSDIVESINEIIKTDKDLLAKTLRIDKQDAKKIEIIHAFYVIDLNNNGTPDYIDYKRKYKETDVNNIRMTERLCVRVVTKSKIDTEALQKGIIYFLLENQFMDKETLARNKLIRENIKALDKEIAELDSLRRIEYKNGSQISIKMGETLMLGEKKTYHKEILDLVAQKEVLQSRISLRPDAINIDSPVKVTEGYPDFLMFVLLTGGFLLIGFFIALIIEYRQQMIKVLKE